jgi:hypothetical protein
MPLKRRLLLAPHSLCTGYWTIQCGQWTIQCLGPKSVPHNWIQCPVRSLVQLNPTKI